VTHEAFTADVVVMAAAVADFRPAVVRATKIKKDQLAHQEPEPLVLERTPDILAELVSAARDRDAHQVIVGFAAETAGSREELVRIGRDKLLAKGCDLLVCNEVGGTDSAFESLTNEVVIVSADDRVIEIARADKDVVADAVWDHIIDVAAAP
jgi:phosphopantothenoylcysteine decarboxylase/phosphopantothenate--cysteine ligase